MLLRPAGPQVESGVFGLVTIVTIFTVFAMGLGLSWDLIEASLS